MIYHQNNVAGFVGNHVIYSTLQSFLHPLQRIAKASTIAWFKIALEEHKPVFTDATFTNFGLDAEEMHRYMYMMS